MDESTTLKLLIEEIVKRAVLPLETEIKSLRTELESLKTGAKVFTDRPKIEGGTIIATSALALEQLNIDIVEPPVVVPQAAVEVPAERTDFARFLQRGLEQEQVQYKEEKPDAAPTKKGWNPFKR